MWYYYGRIVGTIVRLLFLIKKLIFVRKDMWVIRPQGVTNPP